MATVESRQRHWTPYWVVIGRALAAALRALGTAVALTPPPAPAGLHECPECRRDRVCPVDWETEDEEHWAISLRCGECGARREVVAANAQAVAFDVVLRRHQRAIERTVSRLDAERMATELDAFVRALAEDLIDAADFAR